MENYLHVGGQIDLLTLCWNSVVLFEIDLFTDNIDSSLSYFQLSCANIQELVRKCLVGMNVQLCILFYKSCENLD